MAADKCGARRDGLVCDRAPHVDGDHRGYLESVDEVLFWPSTGKRLEVLAVAIAAALEELEPRDRELAVVRIRLAMCQPSAAAAAGAGELEAAALQTVLGLDQPWAIPDVLERLAAAADHLLLNHSCDHMGYEGINAARDAARAHVERLGALRSRSSARG